MPSTLAGEIRCGERAKRLLHPSGGRFWVGMWTTAVGADRGSTHEAGLSIAARAAATVFR